MDNHRGLRGKNDEDVGFLHPAAVIPQSQAAPLRDVFPPFGETRRFEDPLQRYLAPAAEKLRIAPQGLGKTVGLTAASMAGFDQQLDLLFEREKLARLRFVSRLVLLLTIL